MTENQPSASDAGKPAETHTTNKSRGHSRRTSRNSRRAKLSTSGGSGKSKRKDRINTLKKSIYLGIYIFIMYLSFSRLMEESRVDYLLVGQEAVIFPSFWMDLSAFCLLWLYFVLIKIKVIKEFKITKLWFYSHMALVLVHLFMALYLSDIDPTQGKPKPVHQKTELEPVFTPYEN